MVTYPFCSVSCRFHHEYESAVKLVNALSRSDSSKYRCAPPASIKNSYQQKFFGTNRNAIVYSQNSG
jgi:hypothetical protein